LRLALTLTPWLGLLNCRFVVPAVTARFANARRGEIGGCFGFFVTTPDDGRAAPGRELVDRRGPVIQTRIHPCSPYVVAPVLMLRPTPSPAVTEFDIVLARGWCNLIKTKSFAV
jgi:hypothetical protein